jgi:hypothetical protein
MEGDMKENTSLIKSMAMVSISGQMVEVNENTKDYFKNTRASGHMENKMVKETITCLMEL